MAYELYKKIKTKEAYFNSWETDNWKALSEELKDDIYNRYVIRCKVYQRDEFKCQNTECKYPDSPLTFHHIKARRNKGGDKVRNGLTVCKTCHKRYEHAKAPLVINDNPKLPAHIRGMTYRLSKPETFDWKAHKAKMSKIRAELKAGLNKLIKELPPERRVWFRITSEQISLLMRILTIPYDEWED